MNTSLHRKIMRRVYTAFAARIVSHSIMLNVAIFAAALAIFAHVVHVHKVIQSIFSVPLGALPDLVLNAVMRGEVVTLAAIGVMTLAALSVQWRVRRQVLPLLQLV